MKFVTIIQNYDLVMHEVIYCIIISVKLLPLNTHYSAYD